MNENLVTYKETIEMSYHKSFYDKKNPHYIGGVVMPKKMSKLLINVDKSVCNNDKKYTIHIAGTKEQLKEFGKLLINIANHKSIDENYCEFTDSMLGNAEINIYSPESIFFKNVLEYFS